MYLIFLYKIVASKDKIMILFLFILFLLSIFHFSLPFHLRSSGISLRSTFPARQVRRASFPVRLARRAFFHSSTIPFFHHSILPPFHSSILPLFHYSILPIFQHSNPPFFPVRLARRAFFHFLPQVNPEVGFLRISGFPAVGTGFCSKHHPFN